METYEDSYEDSYDDIVDDCNFDSYDTDGWANDSADAAIIATGGC